MTTARSTPSQQVAPGERDDTVGLFIFLAAATSNILLSLVASMALGYETPILAAFGLMACALMFPILRVCFDTAAQRGLALSVWTAITLTATIAIVAITPELREAFAAGPAAAFELNSENPQVVTPIDT